MRSESVKTVIFVAAAVALVAAAAYIEPEAYRPDVFSDQGEPLFPEFRDVMDVKAIEVVDYNAEEAVAEPLKVEFRNNRWVIPSNSDYPAEAGDRLASTAGALLDLHKDLVVSDRIEDHARYGVVDPLDQNSASLTGRGKRVTLRDAQGDALAEVVLGKAVEDHEGYRYVRLPGQKRVYGAKTAADPSARFSDWVEANLLRLSTGQLQRVTLNRYSIDETFGRILNSERVELTKDSAGKWTASGDRRPSSAAIDAAIQTLGAIRVTGARPKPKSLADSLSSSAGLELTMDAVVALRERGYFVTAQGRLYANEGELMAETTDGVVYTLRFGEIVSGGLGRNAPAAAEAGETPTAEQPAAPEPEAGQQDRYLFVTASAPAESEGSARVRTLTRKFADWFYVISGPDFQKLTLR